MPIGTRPQEQREVRADPRQETTAVATPPRRAPRLRARNAPGVLHEHGGGIAMIAVGAVLALWSLTGAVRTLMWALNIAYDRPDRRGFVRTRVAALAMLVFCGIALALVFCVLVLGPQMTDSV